MRTLEVCCYSVECAKVAESAGADRIELCASQADGGITPSYGSLKQAKEKVSIPVHPIIRPRGGDFCYSRQEMIIMKEDIAMVRDLGFPGLVLGVLDEDGHIHSDYLQALLQGCHDMAITFHRAFDMCVNPQQALQQLTDLGIARILTSGQQQTAEMGLPLLRELIETSKGPIIMPGSGVSLTNLHKFIEIGAQELHSSAGHHAASVMRYRKAGVTMCSDSEFDEFSHYCVDSDKVEAMKAVLQLGK